MYVIELAGLPGCGKTTAIENILNKPEYSQFITRSDLMPDKTMKKDAFYRIRLQLRHLRTGLYFIWLCLHPSNLTFLYHLICVCKKYSAKSKYFVRLFRLYNAIKAKRNSEETAILDEGLLQFFTSLSLEKEFEKDSHLIACLKEFKKICDMEIIYCWIPVGISMERLKKRNRSDRYTLLEADRQEKLLKIKQKNIEHVLEWSGCNYIPVDMAVSKEIVSDAIAKELQKIKTKEKAGEEKSFEIDKNLLYDT